jgi:peptidoglycan/LPS O-acetylase OafA/YrhL
VRKLAVPDLTTTVLTMTLTGIAADTSLSGRGATIVRRALAVIAMFAGAIIGALIVLHDGRTAGLSLALALVAAVSISALLVARKPRNGTPRAPDAHAPRHVGTGSARITDERRRQRTADEIGIRSCGNLKGTT